MPTSISGAVAGEGYDDMRKRQMEIVAFTTNLLGSAVIGFIKMGIPQINWICFARLVKAFLKLIMSSNDRIRILWTKTEELLSETELLRVQTVRKQIEIEQDIVAIMKDPQAKRIRREKLINQFGGTYE